MKNDKFTQLYNKLKQLLKDNYPEKCNAITSLFIETHNKNNL